MSASEWWWRLVGVQHIIRSCPKLQDRAPSEQSKLNERLEENVVEKVNLCGAAASIITGASRCFALSSSLDSRDPRFEDASLRSNGGGKLAKGGIVQAGGRCCGKVRGRYRGSMQDIVARSTFESGVCRYVKAAYDGDARRRRL